MLPFGVHLDYGPWPWSLLSLVSAALWITAIVVAWRSADLVIRENRPWTRAARLLVASIGPSISGVWVPIGSVYVIVKHHRSALRAIRRAGVR